MGERVWEPNCTFVDEMNWKWGVTSLPNSTQFGAIAVRLLEGAQYLTGVYNGFDEQITVDPRYYMSLSVSNF